MAENEAPEMHGPRLDLSKLQNKNKNNKRNSSRSSSSIIQRIPMTTSHDNHGLISPPSSQPKEMEVEQEQETRQLISPPPEEELRSSRQSFTTTHSLSNSKRKRSVQASQNYSPQVTPNPKPRKQYKQAQPMTSPTKSRYRLLESPHASNPNADFLPPFGARARFSDEPEASTSTRRGRRSATPIIIPPYEPPNETFTPPREITLTPSPTKPKRSSRKSVRKTLSVKVEPPSDMEALLKEPMPPASPTDDPLLLSDSVEPEELPRAELRMDVVAVTPRRPTRRAELEGSLPPSSPPSPVQFQREQSNDLPISSSPVEGVDYFFPRDPPNTSDMNGMSTSDDDDDVDMDISLADAKGPIPSFVWPPRGKVDTANGEWSDEESDDEMAAAHLRSRGEVVGDGEGEYTGQWRMWQVRTKCDPPSSATKSRMDSWGRPISPYPPELLERKESPLPGSNVVEDDNTVQLAKNPAGDRDGHDDDEEEEEREVRAMSIEPETVAADGEADGEGDNEQEEAEVRAMSIEPEDRVADESNVEEGEAEGEAQPMQFVFEAHDGFGSDDEDEDEREEEEVREMSYIEEGEEVDEDNATPDDALPTATSNLPESPEPQAVRPTASVPGTPSRTPLPTTIPLLRDLSFLQTAKSPFGSRSSRPSLLRTRSRAAVDVPEHTVDDAQVVPPAVAHDVDEEHVNPRDSQMEYQDVEVELPDDEESSDEDDDPGLVKITSSDPRAAARAAAILKQHDYDCFTKITAREKRRRHSSYNNSSDPLDSLKKGNRRRTVTAAGVGKSLTPGLRDKSRRHSLGTVVGEKVYMPGSPVVTLSGLLNEAEKEVDVEVGRNISKVYETPLPRSKSRLSFGGEDGSQSEWTKEDWKTLDACFTDERIALVNDELDGDDMAMAEVDVVDLDKVIDRYLELVEVELEEGSEGCWTRQTPLYRRDSIRARAEAIKKKQSSGKVAPPTPAGTAMRSLSLARSRLSATTKSTPVFSTPSGPSTRVMETPAWTPGMTPLPKKYTLPPAIGSEAPFSSIKMPRTKALMAPRYGYLLEEAERVSRGEPSQPPSSEPHEDILDDEDEDVNDLFEVENSLDLSRDSDDSAEVEDQDIPSASVQQPQGLGGRMKGIIFSYLPTLSKNPQPTFKKHSHPRTGLPLPPADVLSKQRGPVATPARPVIPRERAPKELVTLNHQEPPPETKIPKRKEKPKRLVELKNVQPPPEPEVRKSTSGAGGLRRKGSVKDLVKGFEELERSSSSLGVRGGGKGKEKEVSRPAWRP
ncbi:hypothetical protein V5O48_001415 [Marasmius crinis-equi]|uniref:Uncharacterized protein n=1 Tax=Marasmius crinis-equi TaxID=585013 RepID=A0ABR3FZM2_9AGAR